MADSGLKLMGLVKEAIKARGLRISEVPPEMCKVIVGRTVDEIEQIRIAKRRAISSVANKAPVLDKESANARIDAFYKKAIEVRKILDSLAGKQNFCSPMSETFRNTYMLQDFNDTVPVRTDLCLAIALQTDASGKDVTPVAVAAWGEADFLEPAEVSAMPPSQREALEPVNRYKTWFAPLVAGVVQYSDVNDLVLKHKVLSIDLVCADDEATKKSGSLLFMYALVKNLNKKSGNMRRYDAVILEAAAGPDPREINQVVRPIANLAIDVGFRLVENIAEERDEDEYEDDPDQHFCLYAGRSDLRKFILDRINPLRNSTALQREHRALPNMEMLGALCATQPGSGIPYCT